MPLLTWFWRLKLRWRIPLGLSLLLGAALSVYLLVAWAQYRRCRHLDLLALVPERMPLVVRCRDGGRHWDRLRPSDFGRMIENQIRRRGPLVELVESATGRTWDDLVAPVSTGPASGFITEARVRGLAGTDVIVAGDPAPDRPTPRAVLLTRIGFLEALAFPVARRVAAGRLPVPLESVSHRGIGVFRGTVPARGGPPSAGAPAAPGGLTFAFALRGDILVVATDGDLLADVLDRTFRDWAPEDETPPWTLPDAAPLAAGIDIARLPPGSATRDLLRLFPLREVLLPLDPETLGRCTIALDVREGQVRVEAACGMRAGAAAPAPPVPPPAAGAATALAAVPDTAIAFVSHRVPFADFWTFFEKTALDPARPVAAGDVLGNSWKFFQNQARDIELPALRRNGLNEHLLPHLRAGPTIVLTREASPAAPKAGDIPPQTVLALLETSGTGDTAETALHELLARRIAPLNAQHPNDVTETMIPAGPEQVRLLQRKSWPVQVAYGEMRGVLGLSVRTEPLVRATETLAGTQRPAVRSPRFKALAAALDLGGGWEEGRTTPGIVSVACADLRRLSEMGREVTPDLARFAKDRINGPQLRASIEARTPRQPSEAPAAYAQRISGLFQQEIDRVVGDARRKLEAPLKMLDLFSAGGLAVTATAEGYRVTGVLLLQ
jgi:hypothetical protein